MQKVNICSIAIQIMYVCMFINIQMRQSQFFKYMCCFQPCTIPTHCDSGMPSLPSKLILLLLPFMHLLSCFIQCSYLWDLNVLCPPRTFLCFLPLNTLCGVYASVSLGFLPVKHIFELCLTRHFAIHFLNCPVTLLASFSIADILLKS